MKRTEFDVWIRQDEINFAPQTLAEEVIQNVITVCSTMKYSVPLDRAFGVEARFLDEPVNAARAKYTSEIIQAVRKFEPRARVTRVDFEGTADGQVFPRVRVRIVGS